MRSYPALPLLARWRAALPCLLAALALTTPSAAPAQTATSPAGTDATVSPTAPGQPTGTGQPAGPGRRGPRRGLTPPAGVNVAPAPTATSPAGSGTLPTTAAATATSPAAPAQDPAFPALQTRPGVQAGDLPAANTAPAQAFTPENSTNGPLAVPADQSTDVATPVDLINNPAAPAPAAPVQVVPLVPGQGTQPTPPAPAQTAPPASSAGAAVPVPTSSALTADIPNPDELVTITFVDDSAPQVLRWLERNTGKVILQSQSLPQTRLNFSTGMDTATGRPRALPRREVVLGLESLLSMNGVVLMPMSGRFLRAVTADNLINQGPMVATNETLSSPANQSVYRHFFTLKNITSDDAARLLTPLMSPRISSLISFERSNSILVTDTLLNLQNITLALEKADVQAQMQEEILYLQLNNARAADLVTRLTSLQGTLLRRYLQNTTSFVADDRTNQVIAVTAPGTAQLIQSLVTSLDKDVDPKTKAEVIYLKQALAPNVTTLIQTIISGQQQIFQQQGRATIRGAGPQGIDLPPGTAPGLRQTITTGTTTTVQAERDQQFSNFITVVPDDRSNAIVVFGTQGDIDQVKRLVDKIDVQLAQVRIQVVITEVTLSKKQASGLSSFGINYHFLPGSGTTPGGPGGPYNVGMNTAGPTLPGVANSPQILALNGSVTDFSLNMVFNVAETNSNVRVLSDPTITTMHNQQAVIQVTEQRPIITSTTTQIQNSVQNGANNVTSTVQYTNIGITLQVLPFIGPDGNIVMNISQVADNVVDNQVINGVSQPIIGHRQATSWVTVKDGELLVMAGMQRVEKATTRSKVYILGDIPIIGELFRPKSDDDKTVELIIFIKPTIVASTAIGDMIAETTAKNSLIGPAVVNYLNTGTINDPPPAPTPAPASSSQGQLRSPSLR